ncbi:hypothetical protein QAD02_019916 [Eretmocerus hayati]|uniref:Uncharacterized protein n=1 Tax=Eretmocerus hayati TaxID=131215 RepID=A0ACC2PNG2_9HYME|nr:hypothetical protein QAD02_019916 [Eretmocerus hayati]
MEKIVLIREAKREDCQEICNLIQELADYEEMPDGPKIDSQVLEKDGFGRTDPLFNCFVAISDDKIVGYALYFYIHSTLERGAIHLEDLYVTPEYRKKRVGSRLFEAIAQKTFRENLQYLEFSVLSWNPAQDFYRAKGSIDLTIIEGWHMYRVDEKFLNISSQCKSDYYQIREARADDSPAIIRLAQNLFESRKANGANPNVERSAQKDFQVKPKDFLNRYFVVEQNNEVKGYALYCLAYSTWEGKSMYLQELFVSSDAQDASHMKKGLFSAVAQKARDEMCCRIDFWIHDPKTEGEFFKVNGAQDLTESEEWHLYRLSELPKNSTCQITPCV